jgi:phosphoribosylaminoimidazolecarboxamide formyltransferase/IMP cyclohydrolase
MRAELKEMHLFPIRRALLSVSDKEGIIPLAQALVMGGVEIISTGGTAKALTDTGIKITPIEKITGNPESFHGRMKTISFEIESALLFQRGDAADEADAKKLGIVPIDLVVCNLYPFEKVAEQGLAEDVLVENIDIGGPTMVRAAAKNFASVTVLTHPSQYAEFLKVTQSLFELVPGAMHTPLSLRKDLALAAFHLTAQYDCAVAGTLSKRFGMTENAPLYLIAHPVASPLRYGENPHQAAKLYQVKKELNWREEVGEELKERPVAPGIVHGKVLQGKELSYNNWVDADSAWKCAYDLKAAAKTVQAVVIVKHANPCGAAAGSDQLACLQDAWEGDPVSSFGSIICFTEEVGGQAAHWLAGESGGTPRFVEVIVAPGFSSEAAAVFAKKKNLRLIACPNSVETARETIIKSLSGGGLLVQEEDEGPDSEMLEVTKSKFPPELKNLIPFGIMVTKHLKSNGIGLVARKGENLVILGTGMGQPNRIDSLSSLAVPRARSKEHADMAQAVLISDAFFPFADSIAAAESFGLKYIVQPGGSIRDNEVIEACDQHKISMVFTKRRHFRH